MIDLPAKYVWPGLVATLLLGSIAVNAAAIWLAHRSGGPHEVGGTRAEQTAPPGEWRARAERREDRLLVSVRRNDGTPVAGLEGSVSPLRADRTARLRPHPEHLGTYVASFESALPAGPMELSVASEERNWRTTVGAEEDR